MLWYFLFTHKLSMGTFIITCLWPILSFPTISILFTTNSRFCQSNSHFGITSIIAFNFRYLIKVFSFSTFMYHLYSGTNDKEVSFLRTTWTCLSFRYLGTVTLPNGPLNYSKPVNGTSGNTFLCLSSATRITCISSKICLVMKCRMQSYIKRYFIVAFLIIDFPYLWEKLWLKVFPYVPFSLRTIMEYSSFKDFVVFIHIIVSW